MTTPTDITVLILRDKEAVHTKLSLLKNGDVFLQFPHLRIQGLTHAELRKQWAKATSDAEIHTHDDGHREWCVNGRRLIDEEWDELFKETT